MSPRCSYWFAAALLASVAMPAIARAQVQSADAVQPDGFGDIVVTARRTEERLQEVPVAISAFSAEQLEMRNVDDLQSLARIAPGLSITPANSPTTLVVTIRGLGNTNPNTGADATVGVYINDVPINLQNGTNIGMFDLQGLQVLKGPQGTLFGRNTTGGAILINAAKPTDVFEGYVQGGGTFFRAGNGWQGEAVVNVPLSDTLSVRLAANVVDRDGYVRNILPRNTADAAYGFASLPFGRTDFKNQLPQRSQAWRASLRWTPNDAIENVTFYEGSHLKSTGLPTYATALNPASALVQFAPLLGYPDPIANYAALNAYKEKYWWATMSVSRNPLTLTTTTLSNSTTVDLSDTLTLKNIVGYRRVREEYGQDIVGLGAQYFEYRQFTGGYNFSDELQLQGTSAAGRLRWIGGLFYFEEKRFADSTDFVVFGGPGGAGVPDAMFDSRSKSYSAFGQATFQATDSLSLTAGLRYTIDRRSGVLVRPFADATGAYVGCSFVGKTLADCSLAGKDKFKALTYTLSADYKIDEDTLIYLASRRGYRSGGFSASQTDASSGSLIPFKPEKVTDYELGFKRDWRLGGDAQLRTNLAIYRQNYSDIQRLSVDPNQVSNQIIINVPKATVTGGELDVVLAPVKGVTLTYGYAYVKPEYDRFIVGTLDNSDNTFSYAPRHSHTLSASFEISTAPSFGSLTLGGDWSRRSKAFHDDQIQTTRGGVYPVETLIVKPYSLVGLNAKWTGVLGSDFDLELFATNLTNAKVLPNGSPSTYPTLGQGIGFYGIPPRMIGFNLRYSFGN